MYGYCRNPFTSIPLSYPYPHTFIYPISECITNVSSMSFWLVLAMD